MRPGEPPTREAAEACSRTCSSPKTVMTCLRLVDEVQPFSAARRNRRFWYPEQDDIIDVMKKLIDIRNGKGEVMISTTSATVVSVPLAKWRKTVPRWPGTCRACGERASVSGDLDTLMPQDMINAKPISAAVKSSSVPASCLSLWTRTTRCRDYAQTSYLRTRPRRSDP